KRHSAINYSEEIGFGSISNELGTQMIEQVLANKLIGVLCFTPINWNKLKLSTQLVSHLANTASQSVFNVDKLITKEQNDTDYFSILSNVRQCVNEIVPEDISDDSTLMDNGLDSLGSVMLAQSLSQEFDLSLNSIFVINNPTIKYMAEEITKKKKDSNITSNIAINQEQTHDPKSVSSTQKPNYIDNTIEKKINEPIAVIGTACRLPGDVTSTKEFWEMLKEHRDCVTDVPQSRFDIESVYSDDINAIGKSYTKKGAFMSNIENFDYEFFNLTLPEAQVMDPQQRILLEVAYEAFYNAGYKKQELLGSNTAIYIGQMSYDWSHMELEGSLEDPYYAAGSSPSIT
ncbi:beta-ketoacyl synthase N-terminal-like domain-containing protein, partial [Staphylococcus saprophyticus]